MSEELIVRNCAPTLAGLKTGNLFSCEYSNSKELFASIRALNLVLVKKGLRVVPMKIGAKRALIYLYRPSQLKRDLDRGEASALLAKCGYPKQSATRQVASLVQKMRVHDEFPHEIGLFLGYPPEDVCGFMEDRDGNCKYVGVWKVYGDEENAKKTFARYKKCTDVYTRMLKAGTCVEKLAVAR